MKGERVDVAVIMSGIELCGSCEGDKEGKKQKHGWTANGRSRID